MQKLTVEIYHPLGKGSEALLYHAAAIQKARECRGELEGVIMNASIKLIENGEHRIVFSYAEDNPQVGSEL